MADFNSSDLDFSLPEVNGPRIGRRAIASIKKHSMLDRIESKKTLKTLKDVGNAPGTTIAHQYSYALFMHFAAVTLRIHSRPNKTPTGDDVVRFISRLSSHLQSKHSDGKIAWTVIKNAKAQLDRALSFHYADYQLSRHYALRVDATIQKLKNYLMTMCLFPGCKTDAEFANYVDYTTHLKKTHSLTVDQYPQYMPTLDTVRLHPRPQHIDITTPVDREFVGGLPCSHADCCTSTAVYITKDKLDSHLKQSHKVTAHDRRKYYPGVEIAPFYGTQCLHSDCAAKRRFYPTEAQYKYHLKTKHKLSTIAEFSSHQLWWKQKYPQGEAED